MLNDLLYRALKATLGPVLVENSGEHAEIERDPSSVYTTSWRISDGGLHGEQYRVNCPFCKGRGGMDHGHHLYVSYLSYARPVVGGEALSMGPLMAHCFRRDCMSDPDNRDALATLIGAGMAAVRGEAGGDVLVDLPDLSEDPKEDSQISKLSSRPTLEGIRTWAPGFEYCTVGCSPDIDEYLTSRGVDARMREQFSIGWGPLYTPRTGRPLNGGLPWVIVPVTMNGELKGIQGRCPDALMAPGSTKYWIHPGMRKKGVVYNLDSARALGTAVLCEGVFDVFKVGAPGVCCFGHILSPAQRALLATVGQCMLMLPDTDPHEDFDTVEEARSLASAWNAAGMFTLGAHVIVLPAKDAGEMSRQDLWTAIVSQVPGPVQDHLVGHVLPAV